jgi:hypothetical protein
MFNTCQTFSPTNGFSKETLVGCETFSPTKLNGKRKHLVATKCFHEAFPSMTISGRKCMVVDMHFLLRSFMGKKHPSLVGFLLVHSRIVRCFPWRQDMGDEYFVATRRFLVYLCK